jgi:hypothetical protein
MPIPYTEHRWFYPPRSKSEIPYKDSAVLRMWKRFSDAVGQFKMNGTNDQLVVFPDGKIEHWGRHKYTPGTRKPDPNGVPDKMDYVLPPALKKEILSFTPKGFFTIYNVELMHAKTTMVKNTLYFFDVLVWKSQHLVGVPYGERYGIIHGCLGDRWMPLHETRIDNGLFIAQNLPPSAWDRAWQDAQTSPYTEGLFYKRTGASSILQVALSERNNGDCMCRSRKGTKNARF